MNCLLSIVKCLHAASDSLKPEGIKILFSFMLKPDLIGLCVLLSFSVCQQQKQCWFFFKIISHVLKKRSIYIKKKKIISTLNPESDFLELFFNVAVVFHPYNPSTKNWFLSVTLISFTSISSCFRVYFHKVFFFFNNLQYWQNFNREISYLIHNFSSAH